LKASQVMQMEVEFVRMQKKYREDGHTIWHHGPPRIFEMFLDNLRKMQENASNGSRVCKNAKKIPWRWAHDLTSWPQIFEMFLDNLRKMQENASIDWVTHLKLD
jgi:hypothetical protein